MLLLGNATTFPVVGSAAGGRLVPSTKGSYGSWTLIGASIRVVIVSEPRLIDRLEVNSSLALGMILAYLLAIHL